MTAPSSPAPLYLGVDGGGTKTVAVVVDADGRVRGRGAASGSNQASLGTQAAVEAVLRAARTALRRAGAQAPCEAAWIGLAGVHSTTDAQAIQKPFTSLARMVRVTNDAEMLLGALPRGVGVALISGTGSIAWGRNAVGETARCGGWGHVFGDEGSGYGLGSAALRAVARAADGRGRPTALTATILGEWEIATTDELIARAYLAGDKAQIAALAPLVIAVAEAGDEAARAIVREEAEELARQGATLADTLRLRSGDAPIPLALGGRLLVGAPSFRAQVQIALERVGRWEPIVEVEEPALDAARALRPRQASTLSVKE